MRRFLSKCNNRAHCAPASLACSSTKSIAQWTSRRIVLCKLKVIFHWTIYFCEKYFPNLNYAAAAIGKLFREWVAWEWCYLQRNIFAALFVWVDPHTVWLLLSWRPFICLCWVRMAIRLQSIKETSALPSPFLVICFALKFDSTPFQESFHWAVWCSCLDCFHAISEHL